MIKKTESILGLEPGYRAGIKAVIVDSTGKTIDFATVFHCAPNGQWNEAIVTLAKLIARYNVSKVGIGTGPGARQTDMLIGELMLRYPDLKLNKVIVSQAHSSPLKKAGEFDEAFHKALTIANKLLVKKPTLNTTMAQAFAKLKSQG